MGNQSEPTLTWIDLSGVTPFDDSSLQGQGHPSRRLLTRLLEDGSDEAAWLGLRERYDSEAESWAQWADTQPGYDASVQAALELLPDSKACLEVGAGSGQASRVIASHADLFIGTDLNFSMISRSGHGILAVADVRALPFPAGAFDRIVGLNAVPSVPEFKRVLSSDGMLVWCSTYGGHTPIYTPPERIVSGLGPAWRGVAARVESGDFLIAARRDSSSAGLIDRNIDEG